MSRAQSLRRFGRVRTLVIPVLAAALAASACGSDSAGGAGGSPKSGGTLTFAFGSDPTCLDPQQIQLSEGLTIGREVVDTLTDQDPKTLRIVPWLAERWDVSPDAKTFTFHLRSGVTFSDGAVFDATAVQKNFDAVVALGAKATLGYAYLSGYVRTVVVDAHTARVEFKAPNAQFLQATTTPSLGFVSPASLSRTPAQRCSQPPVGSGPFVVDSYAPNQRVTLSRRTDYAWASPLARHTGAAYLNKIVFTVVAESGVRTGSLKSGQVDGISQVSPQDALGLEKQDLVLLPTIHSGIVSNLHASPSPDRPVLRDPSVLPAVQRAINRKQLVDTLLNDDFKPATSILGGNTPGHTDLSSLISFDPAAAKKLLDTGGWQPGRDGIRTKDGRRLHLDVLWVPSGFGPEQSVLELIQQQLAEVGIELGVKRLSLAQFTPLYQSNAYDLFWARGTTRADPDILRTIFGSKKPAAPGSAQAGIDKLLNDQNATVDTTRRNQLVEQAQRRILEAGYGIPVFEQTSIMGFSPKVKGVTFTAHSWLQFFDTWIAS
ncbi:peptide/nickel transport system substrate-binding protein [Frankia sp. AiPs1]|uniref:ABC transporter substrate-binding protein n=1 Tax=Frankia sp. AiPa1 TaxID=573492 RepID=UPI00202B6E9D|nr:ABC transporter substrate-binding protein [Frankia sp. AiPa1]MCL9760190.1 ABC transporter substrate-binding protein [Frankia sp. AiPa1]